MLLTPEEKIVLSHLTDYPKTTMMLHNEIPDIPEIRIYIIVNNLMRKYKADRIGYIGNYWYGLYNSLYNGERYYKPWPWYRKFWYWLTR